MPLLPFRIEFSGRAIGDLHRRLDAARYPEIPFATGWSAGADDGVLRDLVRHWRTEFDWFAVQERLNGFAHLRGEVASVDVDDSASNEALHCVFLARRDGGTGGTPIVLLHGWPGSFLELLPAAELLADRFEVVVPSLPGYGFSEAPRAPGMHPGRIAERIHALMSELGYARYGVQGGDWGAIVGSRLARQHPEAVAGLHLNFPGELIPPPPPEERSAEADAYLERLRAWRDAEGAYSALQGTKPQTLGYALHDSPVGQLAWILEKFWGWSDHGEDLWETFSRDDVLANVTLYWLTGTALSSARTYYERNHERPRHPPTERCMVPTAYADFRGEPWRPSRELVERSYDLVRWSELERGGHFAALEQPLAFAGDVAAFFEGRS